MSMDKTGDTDFVDCPCVGCEGSEDGEECIHCEQEPSTT
jgi:hypothetical protein